MVEERREGQRQGLERHDEGPVHKGFRVDIEKLE